MKALLIVSLGVVASGCTVERIGPPGVALTRVVAVPAGDVLVFQAAGDLPSRHVVVEEVWIKDDGEMSPREMESRLRVQAGARGANAIVLHSTNRRDNGFRVDLKLRFDNPFDYYSATAVWIGEGEPQVRNLGTFIGGRRQP